MNLIRFIILVTSLVWATNLQAQIASASVKWQEEWMFDASLNYPLFIENDGKFDLMIGANYTTPNSKFPSGLQPQLTGIYRLVDNPTKDYFLSVQLTSGYLIDFTSDFENQFRLSPHFYLEYIGIFNLKMGYDYLMPFNKGYPFVSIGIGGFYMFKDFKIM